MFGNAINSSKYNKIQRFFRLFDIDYVLNALFVANLIPVKNEKWMLTLERTNWKFGKQNINILTLGIVYDGIAFPLLWIMLDKNGGSKTKERIDLLNEFIKIFGTDKILEFSKNSFLKIAASGMMVARNIFYKYISGS